MEIFGRWSRGLARRLGYELIPTWRLESREFADHLRALFAEQRIDCVIDVGANAGQYRDFLRREVGFAGHIVSFEPIAELAQVLNHRARTDPKWRVFSHALGAEDAELVLNITARPTFSSFLEPDQRRTDKFGEISRIVRQDSVRVRRLDRMASEIGALRDAHGIHLKCDTQGFDLQVISGAAGLLPRVNTMQIELSVLGIYTDMPDYLEALRTLRDLKFDTTGMFPVSRDEALRVVEFDCVAINQSFLHRSGAAANAI